MEEKFTDSNQGKSIEELVMKSDHRILAIWAADCAERALDCFENSYQKDNRPRKAIEACREWARTGIFKMADIRRNSLAAHASAREVEKDLAACFAARAAGQAVATAHVPTHSIAAAIYAAKAVWAANPTNAKSNIEKERDWQYQHLLELEMTIAKSKKAEQKRGKGIALWRPKIARTHQSRLRKKQEGV